jgi:hypothetical protein
MRANEITRSIRVSRMSDGAFDEELAISEVTSIVSILIVSM